MNFVTGATGLVGMHILHELTSKEKPVKALKRSTSNIKEIEQLFEFYNNSNFNKIEWVEGDILDIVSLDEHMNGVDTVYHTAAIVSFAKRDRHKMFQVNVNGTRNVVNSALGNSVNKIGHISSIAALGRKKNSNTYTEKNKWVEDGNNSYYAMTKNLAELEIWRGIEEGLKGVMINPGVILGPGNINQSSGTLFKTVLNGLNYYTNGTNGFIDVRDVARSIIELTEKDISKERFICVSENKPYKELFTTIANGLKVKAPQKEASKSLTNLAWKLEALRSIITRKEPIITKETARTSHGQNYYDNSKLTQELDYQFYTIEEAVNNASAYIKQYHGKR